MKKIVSFLTILILAGVPFVSNAAITYSRTPSGASFSNPLTIDFAVDNTEDLGSDTQFYTLDLIDRYSSPCYPSSTLSIHLSQDFPLGDYTAVAIIPYTGSDCFNGQQSFIYLEGDESNTIFTITEAAPLPTSNAFSFSLPTSTTADVAGTAGNILTNLWIIISLVIGLPLGFYIIGKAAKLTNQK